MATLEGCTKEFQSRAFWSSNQNI